MNFGGSPLHIVILVVQLSSRKNNILPLPSPNFTYLLTKVNTHLTFNNAYYPQQILLNFLGGSWQSLFVREAVTTGNNYQEKQLIILSNTPYVAMIIGQRN